MSFHNSTKPVITKRGTETRIVSFPKTAPETVLEDDRSEFINTLRAANPAVDIDTVTNAIYKYVLGHTTATLRQKLNISVSDDLRQALRERARPHFRCVQFAEEIICLKVALLAQNGIVDLSVMDKCVMDISRSCGMTGKDIFSHHTKMSWQTGSL